jgi:hypothetical protein
MDENEHDELEVDELDEWLEAAEYDEIEAAEYDKWLDAMQDKADDYRKYGY